LFGTGKQKDNLVLEDRLLIRKFNHGNRQVLGRVYEKYKDDLVTLAVALLFDKNTAEDAVHDVFVSFIKSCGKLRVTESLKGYLATCVANSARNKMKVLERHHSVGLDEVAPISAESNSPDLSAMFAEQSQSMAYALRQLPYQQREVILLHLYTGLKFRTIAKSQGESINTIQGRWRYGLAKLRSLLNSEVEK